MTVQTKAVLKTYFVKGAKPTAQNFADLIDSYQDTGSSSSFTPIGQALVNASTQASALSALGIAFVTTAQAQTAGAATGYMNPVLTRAAIESKAPAIATAVISSAYATTAAAIAGTAATGLMNPVLVKNAVASMGAGGLVPIKTVTASAATSVDFVNGSGDVVLDGTYKSYMIVMSDVTFGTDAVNLYFRTSSNSGVSYDSSASDYLYTILGYGSNGAALSSGSTGSAQIFLVTGGFGNDTGEALGGFLILNNPASTTTYKKITGQISGAFQDGSLKIQNSSGQRQSVSAVNAIRFSADTGTISGTFTLYGLASGP